MFDILVSGILALFSFICKRIHCYLGLMSFSLEILCTFPTPVDALLVTPLTWTPLSYHGLVGLVIMWKVLSALKNWKSETILSNRLAYFSCLHLLESLCLYTFNICFFYYSSSPDGKYELFMNESSFMEQNNFWGWLNKKWQLYRQMTIGHCFFESWNCFWILQCNWLFSSMVWDGWS